MIALDISSPMYATNGRQHPFVETPDQRVARAEFVKPRDGDKRVAAWVNGQRQQNISLWVATPLENKPASHYPRHHREPQIHQPHLFSIPEDPISNSYCYSVPYIHPDDEEPFIFYSTSAPKTAYDVESEIIYSTPPAVTPKAKPRRARHARHRRQLSDHSSGLDVIPEEAAVES
ncbi:hypothetical protein BDZ89DRAFT_1062577 [Hymenopellis radicata]|nr:hypothetical protein BDZ89DRAFT_1062577 [Hymenopellis radicata]